jgi:glycosyltransferase involved in cell wall biosynthesis
VGSIKSYVQYLDPRLSDIDVVAPRVTIILTNYNYSKYIRQCLESVAVQDYPALECVVVDDCSQDDSVRRIRNFIDTTKSTVTFKLVTHDMTRGQFAGFRTGFEHSDGTFVSFLDADDLLLPNFVTEHVYVHLSRPPVAFTSSNQYQIDSAGQMIGGIHPDLNTRDAYRVANTISLHRPFWIWATTSSMMFRRAALVYILSNADEAFRKCADNYVCHFCNLIGGSILIPKVLGCYRRHQQNAFSSNPLVGGRLPTGDMRNHPLHNDVSRHIRERLCELPEQFISLLGVDGFLHTLARIAPWGELRKIVCVLQELGRLERRNYFEILKFSLWISLRIAARKLKNRHPYVSVIDLDNVENKSKRTGNQHHCRYSE